MVKNKTGLSYLTGLLGGNVAFTLARHVRAENYFVLISIRAGRLFYMTTALYAWGILSQRCGFLSAVFESIFVLFMRYFYKLRIFHWFARGKGKPIVRRTHQQITGSGERDMKFAEMKTRQKAGQ